MSKVIEENGLVFERFIVINNNKTFIIDVFDGVLILKQLFKYGKVEPILFIGRLISI